MVAINTAITLPVNPAGTTPVITHAQLWKGLVEKSVRPHTGFVAPVKDCEVSSRSGSVIDRTIAMKDPRTFGSDRVHERIELVEGSSAEFIQDSGNRVLNLISQGPGGDDSDMFLTFGFKLNVDAIDGGSDEDTKKQYAGMGVKAVGDTIAKIRELVKGGEEFGN